MIKMETPPHNVFDMNEVEWIMDMIPFLRSKILNKLMKSSSPRMMNSMAYIQKPLLKMMKAFGSRIMRFLGIDPPEYEVIRLREYLVPTADGGKLATDIYLPKPVFKERYQAPTILVRLPYWKDMVCILGYFFASMGYVTILQDTRGCAHSIKHGTNTFLLLEGSDGLDTLRWIAKRFWYNGRIGMWGMSYFGITQLAIAAAQSKTKENLVTCLNPGMASYHNILYHPYGLIPAGMGASVYAVFYSVSSYYEISDVPDLSMIFREKDRISDRLSKYPLLNLYNEKIGKPSWILHFNDMAKIGDPQKIIATINEKLGFHLKANEEDKGEFQKLLRATAYDRLINPQSLIFPHGIGFDFKPTIPMLYVAGHYDMFQEEFIRDLKLYQKAAPDYVKNNMKIIIGPWAHGGMDIAFDENGKIGLGLPNMKAIVDLARSFMPMWWFDFFLKKGKKDISKIPPLQIFILNSKIWRNFRSWPKTTELKLYLHSNGKANSRFGDGTLSEQAPKEDSPDEYDFDPANPVVTQGGRHLFFVNSPHNQSKVEERTDVLVYSSEKLTEGIEIIGEVKLVFNASSSGKDTDFMAKLVDVHIGGKKAINVLDDGVRARFREGDLEKPTLITPDEIYRYEISLGHTAIYFPRGHRIRLEISSSNFPRFDINSNLGGDENDKGYIIAHQKIFHDAKYPSHLILPVFKKG
jgi:predicted acyl esterase